MRLEVGTAAYLQAASSYIRMEVFVLEKGIALADEFDQKDTEAIYSVLFEGTQPLATARFLKESDKIARIGRVAVLKKYRRKQLGRQVVNALEDLAITDHFEQLLIHAELTAAEFYETLGYHRVGKPYDEDGIPCITLSKKI
ncbi:GNAT family N-acetyltransferase [Enterococcus pingfangensis]|uniref:GNAT family N-acetyltransferase n=1 Tax=Enterococcus pingfangensis TaxID=2559924 RepID=UPI001FE6C3F1|nr:GNAT family N-acetyltransferase [Enterococcus pingfangensis]